MKIIYNKESEKLIMQFTRKKIVYSRQTGDVIAKFSSDRRVVSLEFLNALSFLKKQSRALPKEVKKAVFTP